MLSGGDILKWPRTNFNRIYDHMRNKKCRPGLVADISSILCLCSELTWAPDEAAKVVSEGDKVMRPVQVEHEKHHPGHMRLFFSSLLRSELALYCSENTLEGVESIVSTVGGPREKRRLQCLRDANVIKPTSQLQDDSTTDLFALPPELFPFLIQTEGDIEDLELGDIALIEHETLAEGGLLGEGTSSMSSSSPRQTQVEKELNGSVDQEEDEANIVVLIENYTSQEYAGGVNERRNKRRRLTHEVVTPHQAECIGRKRAERREKRHLEYEAQISKLKSNFWGCVNITKRVTDRHLKLVEFTVLNDLILLTGDNSLVKALKDQRLDLEKLGLTILHPPRSLAGV
eukprot:Blabericola_migrator_1__5165@NODE_2663_length_2482_cov_78_342029_g1668_i0_p1_GENE_NODE_2663_length_2482_cov_78_342029_g1668_i0NODE_2663_length_2482_cov_78_342029_g1668_i0_p1_ORF_typecomplete_len344_score57_32DUF1308/PF07000_11/3_4e10DUF4604/PF15377_6/7_6e03DUF4604/PF15377_6/0_16_NODE_2663_length_2482_cov_78_342029_g1668_i06521683